MNALAHLLRALDPRTFHKLCFLLMKERYPSANVHYVEGLSGDEGLDLFAGSLDGRPVVWQCKSFQVTLIGKSQKNQIRDSLRQAVRNFSPITWELCLSMDLDSKAHRWFQHLQDSYRAKGIEIKLFQGMNIVHELLFRRTLRNHFFPNVALDPEELRRLISRSDCFSEEELKAISVENTEQYLKLLEERDARFRYEITVGGDRGPGVFPPPSEPELVAASTDGRMTVKAYVRDVDALTLDPPTLSLKVSGAGVEKMMSLLNFGEMQHLEGKEIVELKSTFPLLANHGLEPGKFDLTVVPLTTKEHVPLRLSFAGKSGTIVYEFVDFRRVRGGTSEVEIATEDEQLPIRLCFVLPAPPATRGKVTLGTNFAGKDVKQVQKALSVIRLLEGGCTVELYSLKHEARLGLLELKPTKMTITDKAGTWVEKLARIAETFCTTIRLPERGKARPQDVESMAFLYSLATGEPFPLADITMTLVKDERNSAMLPSIIREQVPLLFVYPWARVRLFNSEIKVGRHSIRLEKAEFLQATETLARFQAAQTAEGVQLSVRPLGPAKLELLPLSQ